MIWIFFSSLIFTTVQVRFVTVKIAFIFTSLSTAHIYDFFTVIIHHFKGLLGANIVTSSQLAFYM